MTKQVTQVTTQDTFAPRVLMMAAGTGGHVFPALAVAEELSKRGAIIHWLGTPTGMENDLVQPTGYPMHAIDMKGIRGNGIGRLLKLPFTLIQSVTQAIQVIRSNKIDAVVGFGGYVTAPGGLAAKLLGKPLLIHEQNAIAGMSNRYLAKFATKVMQAFDKTFAKSKKIVTVGNPVRESITKILPPEHRFDANTSHTSSAETPLKLLVIGGSLGAQALNENVPAALSLMQKPVKVRHQCGRNHYDATTEHYKSVDTSVHEVEISQFISDMAAAYAWADVIVCRAGALTVTEIQNVGLPAIFVPLPHAVDDHQTANAKFLANADAAFLLPQNQLTGETLKEKLLQLDAPTCLAMAKRGRVQANPESAQSVAEIIWQYVG